MFTFTFIFTNNMSSDMESVADLTIGLLNKIIVVVDILT